MFFVEPGTALTVHYAVAAASIGLLHCGMTEEKRRLRYWLVGETWSDGWFLLLLLAGIFWGLPGLIGAVTSYLALRAVGSKLPRSIAAAAALAIATLVGITCQALLR